MKPFRPLFWDHLNPIVEYPIGQSDFANWQHAHYMAEGYRARVVGIMKNPYPESGQRYESFRHGWTAAEEDLKKVQESPKGDPVS